MRTASSTLRMASSPATKAKAPGNAAEFQVLHFHNARPQRLGVFFVAPPVPPLLKTRHLRVQLFFFGRSRFGTHDPVAAFPLGAVECGIGGLDQSFRRCAVQRKSRYADRDGDHGERLALMQNRQLAQLAPDSFGSGLRGFEVGGGKNDDELLASEAANKILGANAL